MLHDGGTQNLQTKISFSKTGPNLLTLLEAGGVKTASCPTCQPGPQPLALGRPTPVRDNTEGLFRVLLQFGPSEEQVYICGMPQTISLLPSHQLGSSAFIKLLFWDEGEDSKLKTKHEVPSGSYHQGVTLPTGSWKDITPSDVIFLRFKYETQALEQMKPDRGHKKQVGDLPQASSAALEPLTGPAQADGQVHERFSAPVNSLVTLPAAKATTRCKKWGIWLKGLLSQPWLKAKEKQQQLLHKEGWGIAVLPLL